MPFTDMIWFLSVLLKSQYLVLSKAISHSMSNTFFFFFSNRELLENYAKMFLTQTLNHRSSLTTIDSTSAWVLHATDFLNSKAQRTSQFSCTTNCVKTSRKPNVKQIGFSSGKKQTDMEVCIHGVSLVPVTEEAMWLNFRSTNTAKSNICTVFMLYNTTKYLV